MDESTPILTSVKKMLNIQDETTEFDSDILAHINSAFFTLFQFGVGPTSPFSIDQSTTWSSFSTQVPKEVVLDYLVLKTNIIFDPPSSSTVLEAYKDRISELEFRMNILVDSGGGTVSD